MLRVKDKDQKNNKTLSAEKVSKNQPSSSLDNILLVSMKVSDFYLLDFLQCFADPV